ncbi:MAG TPA: RHS repeat domain-containing protein [Alphaproteobacteria bacterium]|jgi:hypothetical protein|nr:RHS repeat domain-containing protein [Alphaproteobacteria bacterium]
MRNPSVRLRARSQARATLAAICLGLPLLTPAPAGASETITYSYDARGRLKQVVHSGSVNNGVTTSYTLDKAGNRTNKTTTGAP